MNTSTLTPAPYADGLEAYSTTDGTPDSPDYAAAGNGFFVPADQDFGGALEILKISSTQRLRYKGETPIVPGRYVQIKVRVKAISGNLPSVRVAAYAARSNGNAIAGVVTTGTATALTTYGEVVEVSAIVGIGNRSGVDMVCGPLAEYGHFGIDLLGQNGGVIRVDDIEITDASGLFLGDIVSTVDVRDYGALGNGSTDDTAAFEAANAAANDRTVLIPAGTFRLNGNVTFDAPTKFEGTVTMPDSAILLLRQNFDLPNYIQAFDNEELAFRKAFQALLNNSDHESLDMGGRKVALTGPIDMKAAVPNRTRYETRRAIHNGQLIALPGGDWDTTTVSATGTYSTSNARTLTNVTNISNIHVGSHITGSGVGREIYVQGKASRAERYTSTRRCMTRLDGRASPSGALNTCWISAGLTYSQNSSCITWSCSAKSCAAGSCWPRADQRLRCAIASSPPRRIVASPRSGAGVRACLLSAVSSCPPKTTSGCPSAAASR